MEVAQLGVNHLHLCVGFDCVLDCLIGVLDGCTFDSYLGVCVRLVLET